MILPLLASLALIPYPQKLVETGESVPTSAVVAVARDAALPAEGYRLTVAANGISIVAADDAGELYARRTLKQLKTADGKAYAGVRIEDFPAFKWRGFMLDDCRHFFGKEVVKRCLDQMADHKLNVFHWHLTEDQGWRIDLKRFPELAEYGSVRPDIVAHGSRGLPFTRHDCVMTGMTYGPYSYSEEDIAEILAYAKERNIRVVPEIEIPGHIQALIAAHPEFSCLGNLPKVPRVHYDISDEVLCAGNDEAIAFLEKVYDEVARIFPDGYIHIGGDECPKKRWKECPKCQARIKALGLKDEEELQGWVTRHFTDYLAKKGRRAIGWDEVLAGNPAVETVIQNWRSAKYGIDAAAKGHDVVVSNVGQTYFSVPQGVPDDPYTYTSPDMIRTLAQAYAFDPYAGMTDAAKKRVLGAECCMWSECTWNLYDLEWKLYPRACAFAERVWSGTGLAFADFETRMATHRKRLIAAKVCCAPLR